MTDVNNLVDMLKSIWTCNNVWELYGDKTEYELIQETIKEIEFLRAEVERLRLRPEELDAIEAVIEQLHEMGWGVAVLRNMLARLGGGE